jgi:hypothetical protein
MFDDLQRIEERNGLCYGRSAIDHANYVGSGSNVLMPFDICLWPVSIFAVHDCLS